jgi:hypothetical protein
MAEEPPNPSMPTHYSLAQTQTWRQQLLQMCHVQASVQVWQRLRQPWQRFEQTLPRMVISENLPAIDSPPNLELRSLPKSASGLVGRAARDAPLISSTEEKDRSTQISGARSSVLPSSLAPPLAIYFFGASQ